jgi:hypothetical protein
LLQVARRLTALQPEPPRAVSLADVLGAYAPVLVFIGADSALVMVIALLARLPAGALAGLVAVLLVGGLLLMGGIVFAVSQALENGMYATGQVISASGMTAVIRVQVRGKDADISLTSRFAGSYQPGARLELLVDPEKRKVLLVLGSAEAG